MIIKQLIVGPIGTNCYLLGDEASKRCAVVDPGGNAEEILSEVKGLGFTLDCILLTHAHFDHTGGVAGLLAACPGIPVCLHPADKALLGGELFPALPDTADYREGSHVRVGGLDVEVLETPGHTPGGVTLRVGDALFTGDTLFRGSMGRTDLGGGSYEVLMGSLRRLGELPGDYRVFPGHEGTTTLEAERGSNYYLMEALR